MIELLQALIELKETLVQSLRVHIEKLVLSLVLRDHVKGEHHRALGLVIHDIISFYNSYFVLIEDVLEGLELVGMAIRLVSTLCLLFRISPYCRSRGRFNREKLRQADLNLRAWGGCFRGSGLIDLLANLQVIIGLPWLCRFRSR